MAITANTAARIIAIKNRLIMTRNRTVISTAKVSSTPYCNRRPVKRPAARGPVSCSFVIADLSPPWARSIALLWKPLKLAREVALLRTVEARRLSTPASSKEALSSERGRKSKHEHG